MDMDSNINERFHLNTETRLKVVATMAATVGAGAGFLEGVKMSSLRFLTENAHRLPRTVGGWYFYHKKKNYIMIIGGCKKAALQAGKYSGAVGGFFGMEAALDWVRGRRDFLNTTALAVTMAWGYARMQRLSAVQRATLTKKGAFFGLMLGLAQDAMIYLRGGDVWYLRFPFTEQGELIGIKPQSVSEAN